MFRGRWALLQRKLVRAVAALEGYQFKSAFYFLRSAQHDRAVLRALLQDAVPMVEESPTSWQGPDGGATGVGVGGSTAITLALLVLLMCAALALCLRMFDLRGRAAAATFKKVR